ncbi:TonB-dependent receptor plug domain-containing protein [Hymenobacter rubidus]|uniref:TonB-dependent receptor plug domain-containing protein n=1 Tax=Hymenobacter rubidus TaxID=1441626 RepID=UPI00191D4FC4|nr:TonB-dependent receptor [Hymenobacter rubidus]
MNKLYTVLTVVAVLWLGLAGPVRAQCDEAVAIPEAEKLYGTGNFDDVFGLLKPCVENGFSESGRIQGYKLLSMTYLAIDSLEQSSHAIARLLVLNPNFEPDFSSSPRYKALVTYVRNTRDQVVQVTSVSKRAENILYAPATVVVLTSKDFEQRGYQTMEQMLHDLPGFDVIKGNGVGYSNFYQRGYRSTSNDRTLILIDGVEENDLVSNSVLLSPQYALSDVDRVEIIYGPASTLYGANAFTGVINIITKSFRSQLGPTRMLGVTAQTRAATYNTRYLDGVLSARTPDVAVSITGRVYRSSSRDLSEYPEWNYQARTAADYGTSLDMTGTDPATGAYKAQQYIQKNSLLTRFPNSNLFTVDYLPNVTPATATAIRITPQGAAKAATLDNKLFGNSVKGNPVGFQNDKFDWLIRGKVEFKDLTISYLEWQTDEGATPWYTNRMTVPAGSNPRWITHDRASSITYAKQFSNRFQILNLASFLTHEIDGATNLMTYNGYYNNKFSFLELARDSAARAITTYQYRISTQLRNELRLFWSPLENLDLNGGFELRSGLIQGNYVTSVSGFADETGTVSTASAVLGGNNFRTRDLGFYGQATYRPIKALKLVAGIRIDNNKVRDNGGYGTVSNPRLAAVYSLGKFVLKGIYAQAFKDASFLQKYGTTTARALANPTLEPERVRNFEGSIYFQATQQLSAAIVAYHSSYNNAVGTAQAFLPNGTPTQQFQPLGSRRIWGLQAEGGYKATQLNIWWNATYTNPIDSPTGLRISDIADYTANAGADYQWHKLSLYLSGNLVGARKTGAGTSGSNNPQQNFDPFLILNSNLTLHNVINGLSLQASVNNLLDKEYFVPGIREADNILIASRFPQDRRFISLGAYYTFPTIGQK